MRKWKGWRKWVTYDAVLLFLGTTMLVTIIFTVMAMNAAELNPDARAALLEGDRDAALPAMASAFAQAAGIFDTLFFVFIAIVGLEGERRAVRRVRARTVRHELLLPAGRQAVQDGAAVQLYLWGVLIFGIIILNFGPLTDRRRSWTSWRSCRRS
jgi:hypothetical protein